MSIVTGILYKIPAKLVPSPQTKKKKILLLQVTKKKNSSGRGTNDQQNPVFVFLPCVENIFSVPSAEVVTNFNLLTFCYLVKCGQALE